MIKIIIFKYHVYCDNDIHTHEHKCAQMTIELAIPHF